MHLKVHAISVPYAVSLFQGTQLFNRELTIRPRNNNNSNVQQRIENPMMSHQQQPLPMRNPFERFSNDDGGRFDRNREQHSSPGSHFDQSATLRAGFNSISTKASRQMQPQPSKRSTNQQQSNGSMSIGDLDKLISMGSNMLQSNSGRQMDTGKKPNYDELFTDRDVSSRHSSNMKMTNRHNSRSHYRDEPYSRRDPPRHQQRNSGDRRRRF